MSGINVVECLKVFRTVVDQGSFSAAAKALHISAAWAAKSVTGLEDHLNVTLLIRSTRSLRLTDAGQHCYRSAGKIIDEIDILQNQMRDEAIEISGTVRVNMPSIFAIQFMGKLAAKFQIEYPKIKLDLISNDNFSDVFGEEYDLVIRLTTSLSDSGLISRKLMEVPRILCATPGYLLQAHKLECVEDLAEHRCLLYSGLQVPDIWQLLENGQLINISPNAFIRVNNSYVIKAALLAGAGLAFLPRLIVENEVKTGEITKVSIFEDAYPLTLYALRAPSKHLPARTRVFLDFLEKHIHVSDC